MVFNQQLKLFGNTLNISYKIKDDKDTFNKTAKNHYCSIVKVINEKKQSFIKGNDFATDKAGYYNICGLIIISLENRIKKSKTFIKNVKKLETFKNK